MFSVQSIVKFEIQKKSKAQIHKFVLQNFIDQTFGDDEGRSEKFACYCPNLQSSLKGMATESEEQKDCTKPFY